MSTDTMNPDRLTVAAHLLRERAYAELRWGHPVVNNPAKPPFEYRRSVGDYLALIQAELNDALAAWRNAPNDAGALKCIRNIGQFVVACHEHNGLPPARPDVVTNARDGKSRPMPAKGNA